MKKNKISPAPFGDTKKRGIKRILFYAGFSRVLRTTMIGHLFELCRIYPVVLLLDEKLDEDTEKIIRNKKYFPKLEKVIFLDQYANPKANVFERNRDLRNAAKQLIYSYRPDAVVVPNDCTYPEMYLLRFAKRINALNVSFQTSLELDLAKVRKNMHLVNTYKKFSGLPKFLRSLLVRVRKYGGHFFYNWILPLTAFEKPFWGKSSYILRKGGAGLRDSDFQVVFSKREYDIHEKDGVPARKLRILAHPLLRPMTRDFFKKTIFEFKNENRPKKTAVLLMPSDELGFRTKDSSFISREEREKTRKGIVRMAAKILKGWKIFIKPHPNFKKLQEAKKAFETISDSVKVVDPSESSDKYIRESQIVVGLPRSASTALFTASLIFPQKAILSLDTDRELLGDTYRDFEGIEYIDREEKIAEVLELVRDNKYSKKNNGKTEKEKEFSDTADLISHLYEYKK